MKVALTGVTGHLGAAVLRELHTRGHFVKALARRADTRSCDGIPVELIIGDILSQETLVPLMQDCDALIHSAGVISLDGDPDGLVHQTNVEGTRNVLEVARRCGIKRVIHISSIHAYKQAPRNEVLDELREQTDIRAFAYDRSKKAGQEIALAMHQEPMELLVINPTAVIGPYDFKPSKAGRMIIDLLTGRLPFVIQGGFDFCDSRDVAYAIVNGLTQGRPGECYLLSGKWHSLRDLVSMLSDASGKRIRVVTFPPILAKAGLPFVRILGWITQKDPIYTNESLEAVLNGNRHVSSTKAAQELNYRARPLAETLRDTFHWFREYGYLRKDASISERPSAAEAQRRHAI